MSFTLVRQEKNDFAHGVICHYKHDKTGCEVMHVHNDDEENAFVFSLPTHPHNSSGVAHILEHTVLCGSHKYQTKAPFHTLFESSCKTYLNALTYPDRTLYPGASTIKQDLFNLMDVYADAIWFPLLRESFFRQEGFYFINTDDAQTTPQTAGVVFNEMKGAYSDREELISDAMHRALFPHNLYAFDSGGDPRDIPSLSYDEFVAFHRRWYRPEYTKILLYGNIATAEYLNLLETQHLVRWSDEPSPAYSPITLHKPVRKTEEVRVSVPHLAHEKNPYSVDVGWVLPFANTATQERLSMAFLHAVLMAIPGAPLRKALLDSGLGEDISTLSGYEGSLYQIVYNVGLTGIKKELVPEVVPFIYAEIEKISTQGFDSKLIEAALQRTEFAYKESLVSTGRKIRWLTSLARIWLYGGDVWTESRPLQSIVWLKEQVRDKDYLMRFLRSALLENTHRAIVISDPDATYDSREKNEEQERINAIWSAQSDADKKYWHAMEQEIEEQGTTPDSQQAIAAIPRLNMDDLPRKVEVWEEECVFDTMLPHGVQWINHNDNGIVYLWLHFDVTDIVREEGEQSMLLPTLAETFTDLGTSSYSYEKLAIRIRKISGVFHAFINTVATIAREIRAFLSVAVHAMSEHIPHTTRLIGELCTSVAYENTHRLTQILHEETNTIKSRMNYYGTQFAMLKAASRYSNLAHVENNHNALGALKYLVHNTKTPQTLSELTTPLTVLARSVYAKNRLRCTVVASPNYKTAVEKALTPLMQVLPYDEGYSAVSYQNTIGRETASGIVRTALCMPSHVAYNACVIPSVSYTDESYVAHAMVGRIASSMLWESIRMKYGAYGAGCSIDGTEQLMEFYTYRDPNIETSFRLFFNSLRSIAEGDFTQDELEKLTIGMVGDALKPISPAKKGTIAYDRMISGISTELRQHIRNSIFALGREKVISAARACLEKENNASFASLCSADIANAQTWQWDSVENVSV